MEIERTLVLIKPDGIQKGVVGEIIARVEAQGLRISEVKMVKMTSEDCGNFYQNTKRDLPEIYAAVEKFMTANFSIAIIIEGEDAISKIRALRGPTDLLNAPEGTVRRDFITDEEREFFRQGKNVKNVMHASGDKAEAKVEIEILFGKEE